jgi:tetratricopeptide (TPR) repeat protein
VRYRILLLFTASLLTACLGQRPGDVTPAEIPDLEARLPSEPDNAALRSRYAAALFAADRCDQATAEAKRAETLRPADAVAAMVIGQCAEKAQRYEDALGEYRTFLVQHPDVRGSAAIRAREQLALRAYSTQRARQALQNEAQLSAQAADPATVAVLPLTIAGDTSYQSLSRGLAQMITSDLALIQRFKLVERLQLTALLDEMQLGQTARADASTAARVGRLMQAGRMVQGTATIPPQGEVRLEASVVQASGEVSAPGAATGRFRDLLKMEKALIVDLSARLGYQLSEAERRQVLENGTQNLAAFLAYSRGLLAEDAGDVSRAAAYFSDAVQSDPGFQAAKEQYQSASVATDVQQAQPGQVTTVTTAPPPAPPAAEPVVSALNTTVGNVASNQSEQTAPGGDQHSGGQGVTTPAAAPPATTTSQGTVPNVTGTIRIAFRLP